ncbi:MAG TPA: DivIVA domain-containing protein [Acidimicrobiales bacterium]|jgi:DivIVA domain-containing protein
MVNPNTRRFDLALRGYERTQVDVYLDRVEGRRPSEPLRRRPDFTLVLRGYDREQVDRYLAGIADPAPSMTVQGETGGDVPALLRKAAESIEERGLEVVDLVLNFCVSENGTRHSMTVYFDPEEDAPGD